MDFKISKMTLDDFNLIYNEMRPPVAYAVGGLFKMIFVVNIM